MFNYVEEAEMLIEEFRKAGYHSIAETLSQDMKATVGIEICMALRFHLNEFRDVHHTLAPDIQSRMDTIIDFLDRQLS